MTKHIIDGPRTRDDGTRLGRYAKLDQSVAEKPSPQSAALQRAIRARTPGEKMKRFASIDRRGD